MSYWQIPKNDSVAAPFIVGNWKDSCFRNGEEPGGFSWEDGHVPWPLTIVM